MCVCVCMFINNLCVHIGVRVCRTRGVIVKSL